MSSTTGPGFAWQVSAPTEWNEPGLLPEHQLAVQGTDGFAWIFEVYSSSLRQRLLEQHPHREWVFIAELLREDARQLFAFSSVAERALFLELWKLDGVGPKTAAQLLAGLSAAQLLSCLQGNKLAGVKIVGVGPKTLEKVSHGLQAEKVRFLKILERLGTPTNSVEESQGESASASVLTGLEKLGLRREDSMKLVRDLETQHGEACRRWEAAEWIRRLLQLWGQQKSPTTRYSREEVLEDSAT